MLYLLSLVPLLFSCMTSAAPLTAHHTWQPDNTLTITIDYDLAPNDAIFKNIQFSFNTPDLEILNWSNTQPATMVYDVAHTQEQLGYLNQGSFIIHSQATSEQLPENAQLFMHYYQKQQESPQEFIYNVTFDSQTTQPKQKNTEDRTSKHVPYVTQQKPMSFFSSLLEAINASFTAIKKYISDLFLKTESSALRLGLVFLLGLFMSLTPCIYPMIPITIGILQTTASNSFVRNFMLAGSYTLGIAMTFATLGFLAATGSAHFGALLGNFYFVLFLVLFLAYLAFSMLGLYEMHIPRFLQTSGTYKVNGSFLSAFLFGAISGSVASPCLSPGLVMLLGIVATMGSKLLGFIYLFLFGLGLGMPLLIIGTFSNALQLAPRAGFWMVEVKKIFGIMLLGMCFFYLNNVLEWPVMLWLMGITAFFIGFIFISSIKPFYKPGLRWYVWIMGTMCISTACVLFYHATKATIDLYTGVPQAMQMSYAHAQQQAIAEQKLLIVDFGARWCSACNEIEHTFFNNPYVQHGLNKYVIVKVDCTNPNEELSAALQKQFNITGLPTILLLEPQSEKIMGQWSSEVLSFSPEEFVQVITQV